MDNRTLEEVRKNETKLIEEIKSLEKQLDYLRSGEYYNQLRFENEMLQQVVDTNGVPSEVYDYIDCTHRNTELLEENKELKKQLEEAQENIILLKASKPMLEYKKAFDKCMKAIKRLLIEEKQCKQKLERIQKEKMNCIRVLLDDKYCEEIIGGKE